MKKRKGKNNTQKIPDLKKDGYYNHHPVFSFKDFAMLPKYYTEKNAKSDKRGLFTFLNSITKFSQGTWEEIKNKPHQFHFHAVDKDVPGLQEKWGRVDLIQFKLPDFKEGRFIGYFNEDNVFCLLIYNSKHTVYSK